MYLRTTQRRNANGSVVRYLQLAHNRRVQGSTQAEILVNLGREDQLDLDALRRLARSIERYAGGAALDSDDDEGLTDSPADRNPPAGTDPRPSFRLWAGSGLGAALRVVAAGLDDEAEDVLVRLVARRALAPGLPWPWVERHLGIEPPNPADTWRVMDLLGAADQNGEVQFAAFRCLSGYLGLQPDTAYVGSEPFRLDSAAGLELLPAVTAEGLPALIRCQPANLGPLAPLEPLDMDLTDWRLSRLVVVADRDEGSAAGNPLAFPLWLARERLEAGRSLVDQILSRQGRYQQVRDDLRVKEVRLARRPVRWIVTHDPFQAELDGQRRDDARTRLEAELKRLHRRGDRRGEDAAAVEWIDAALRHQPDARRWLRESPSGRISLDRARLAAEARFDGKILLSTNVGDVSAGDLSLAYTHLRQAEEALRRMTVDEGGRPVLHGLERGPRGDVLISWLAVLLSRAGEIAGASLGADRGRPPIRPDLSSRGDSPAALPTTSEPGSQPTGPAPRPTPGAPRPTTTRKAGAERRAPGEGRQLLLAAAREVFAERGFDGASTREISERAGISETLLFRNFGSKAALFSEVALRPLTRFWDDWKAHGRDRVSRGLTPEEMDREFVAQFYDAVRDDRRLIISYIATSAFQSELPPIEQAPLFVEAMAELARASQKEVERRALNPGINTTVANRALLSMLLSMALFEDWLVPEADGRASRDEVIGGMTRFFRSGAMRTARK